MLSPEYHSTATLIAIAIMIVLLVLDKIKTSLVFLFTAAALMLVGSTSALEFIEGLSNTAIIKIFLLIIITAGINESFDIVGWLNRLFEKVKTPSGFILRMGGSVAFLSAFMNNTPVVNVMIPFVYQWGKSKDIAPSKLLIPLSFAAIMGGVITLIGTSTNLLLNGLIVDAGLEPLGFFDFTIPGILISVIGIALIALLAPLMLGKNEDSEDEIIENRREYFIEMRLVENSQHQGQTVEEAQLRNLDGFFLTEIIRDNRRITPVAPTEILDQEDVLLFAGDTNLVTSLQDHLPGLELSKTRRFDLVENTTYVEVIVNQNSALDRKSAKEIGFRQKFDAAIIGIHRRGEKLSGKIGLVKLHVGDVLLLAAGPRFQEINAASGDLIVLQKHIKYETLPLRSKALFVIGSLLSILFSALGKISFLECLLIIMAVQVATRMVYVGLIQRVMSLDLLIILLASLSLGESLISSGASNIITETVFHNANQWNSLLVLTVVFFASWVLTSFVTNVAAVSIIFPVAYSLALSSGISYEAIFLSTAFGASCSFITPYAYQTNLMVLEVGKYRFKDYFSLGLVVSLVYALILLTYLYITYLV